MGDSVWNDCPICGGELQYQEHTGWRHFRDLECLGCDNYYYRHTWNDGSAFDQFHIGPAVGGYTVKRDAHGTNIRKRNNKLNSAGRLILSEPTELLDIPTILEFEHFNTEEKIKMLLSGWNDCPLCGCDSLGLVQSVALRCTKCLSYTLVAMDKRWNELTEIFTVGRYSVVRSEVGIAIIETGTKHSSCRCANELIVTGRISLSPIVELESIMEIERFNTEEKIKLLILFS